MRTRLFTILLLIVLAAPAADGFTPLTLGAAPGATNGLATPDQAFSLAATLAAALGEVVEVRLFAAQGEIGQWLNQSEAPALGVFDGEFLAAHPDEFLLLGAADPGGRMQVVARRGIGGDLPQRAAAALEGAGTPSPPAGPDLQRARSNGPILATVTSLATLPPEPAAPLLASAPGPPAQLATAAPVVPMPTSEAPLPTSVGEPPAPVVGAPSLPQPTPMTLPGVQEFQVPRSIGPIQAAVPLLATAPPTPPALVLESAPGLRALPAAAAPLVPMPTGAAPLPQVVSEPPAPVVVEPPLPITAPPAVSSPGGEPPATAAAAPPVAPQASGAMPSPSPPQATPPAEPQAEAPIPASIASPAVAATAAVGAPPTQMPDAQVSLLTAVVEPTVAVAVAEPVVPAPPPSAISTPGDVGPETLPAEAAAAPLLPALERPAPLLTAVVEPVPPVAAVEPTVPVTAPAAIPPPGGELPPTPPAEADTAAALPAPPVAPQNQGEAMPVTPPAEVSPLAAAGAGVLMPAAAEAAAVAAPAVVSASPAPDAEAPLPSAMIEPLAPVAVDEPLPSAAAAELPSPAAEEPFAEIAISSAVPEMIAQPDLPQELRPPAVPLPRPARRPAAAPELTDEPSIVGKFEQLVTKAPKPAPLLAAPDPDPGVIYLVPFVTLMVPPEVHERVFDQFVDTLNQQGTEQRLKFVILKQALNKVDQNWLASRKHVLGEIFGYVEDSGCCSTTIRANVRLLYYRAHQPEPTLRYEYPVQVFFDHDRSNLPVERQKLADQIVAALVNQLFKALQP